MRPTRTVRNLVASMLLAGIAACCPQTAAENVRPTVFSRAQIDFIMYRRDQGDGLADIAGRIGATRPQVRLAERLEKVRLHHEARR
jgi:hypothetical protein